MQFAIPARFRLTTLAAVFAGVGFVYPAWATDILVDTGDLTFGGVAGGGHFNGASVTTGIWAKDGAAEFVFLDDLNLAGDTLRFVGDRGAPILVLNNASLHGADLDLSANGRLGGGAGGGDGGSGGAGGVRGWNDRQWNHLIGEYWYSGGNSGGGGPGGSGGKASGWNGANGEFAFASAVPVPNALPLMLSAMVVLILIGRRRTA